MPIDLALAVADSAAPADVAFFSVAGMVALLTLTALEIVLGIDNIVFIAIQAGRLPKEQQAKARTVGLLLAMGMRIALLSVAFLVMKLEAGLFPLPLLEETVTDPETGERITRAIELSGKDLVLLGGGFFLIWKAVKEIHHLVEAGGSHDSTAEAVAGEAAQTRSSQTRTGKKAATFTSVITSILMLDFVFSIDSVITAVGMTSNFWVMATAVVLAVGVMLVAAGPIGNFVQRHPSMKTLALAFLVLIGVLLIADGLHQHLPRGYVYFAMAFALIVELINLRVGARKKAAAAASTDHA